MVERRPTSAEALWRRRRRRDRPGRAGHRQPCTGLLRAVPRGPSRPPSGCCSAPSSSAALTTNGLVGHAPDQLLRRPGPADGRRRGPAGHHGDLRPGGHDRVRLAHRPVRPAPAAVRLLRPAGPIPDGAAVPAVRRAQPLGLRGLLRPGLDRHRAADAAARQRGVRGPRCADRVRLGAGGPPGGCGHRGVRRRPAARDPGKLRRRLRDRRRLGPGGGGRGAGDPARPRRHARPRRNLR